MTSTPDISDAVTEAGPYADPEQRGLRDALKMPAQSAQRLAPPLTIVSEYRVKLGLAAATAAAPSFEDGLDGVDDEGSAAEPGARGSRWLARRRPDKKSRRSARPSFPRRFESDFMTDARMDRELRRL